MRNNIFRFSAIALCICMLITASVLSLKAENNADETINDHLVSYWDFSGDTQAEMLRDKAPKGTSADNLTLEGNVTIDDGVACIPTATENVLKTAMSDDLKCVENMTIYLKVKYSGHNTSFADMIQLTGLYRIYNKVYNTDYSDATLEARLIGTGGATTNVVLTSSVTKPENEWFYVAVTTSVDFDEKSGEFCFYVSGDGINYTCDSIVRQNNISDTNIENVKKALSSTTATFLLGKGGGQPDRGVDFWLDDVRIYDKVLTENEIMMIQPNTLELRDISDITTESSSTVTEQPSTGTETDKPSTQVTEQLTERPSTVSTEESVQVSQVGSSDTTANTEKGGCSSSVYSGVALICTSAACLAFIKKKKKIK